MAAADYYLCDICGSKTFYDADLSYNSFRDGQENPETHHPWPDGDIGWMTVICGECAKTNNVVIVSANNPLKPNPKSRAG